MQFQAHGDKYASWARLLMMSSRSCHSHAPPQYLLVEMEALGAMEKQNTSSGCTFFPQPISHSVLLASTAGSPGVVGAILIRSGEEMNPK